MLDCHIAPAYFVHCGVCDTISFRENLWSELLVGWCTGMLSVKRVVDNNAKMPDHSILAEGAIAPSVMLSGDAFCSSSGAVYFAMLSQQLDPRHGNQTRALRR